MSAHCRHKGKDSFPSLLNRYLRCKVCSLNLSILCEKTAEGCKENLRRIWTQKKLEAISFPEVLLRKSVTEVIIQTAVLEETAANGKLGRFSEKTHRLKFQQKTLSQDCWYVAKLVSDSLSRELVEQFTQCRMIRVWILLTNQHSRAFELGQA